MFNFKKELYHFKEHIFQDLSRLFPQLPNVVANYKVGTYNLRAMKNKTNSI